MLVKHKGKIPDSMKIYYKLQLFVKDKSVKHDDNLYMIFLCSVEGRGKEFIDVAFGEPKKTIKELKMIYKTLTKPCTELDCIVETVTVASQQPILFLVDTALTI